jgi:hypothetical protein
MPLPTLGKPANQRCEYQRHGRGCAIYFHRPLGCKVFSCRWLANDDADDLRRPDRAHYVIDISPDFIKLHDNDSGKEHRVPVIQIWVDPKYPNAHEDPGLRAWLARRGREGYAALIRYGSYEAFTLFPPAMMADREWHEVRDGIGEPEHSTAEIFDVVSEKI